jgi:hypothetical protein
MNYYPNYNQFYQPQMTRMPQQIMQPQIMQQPMQQPIQTPIAQPMQNIGLQGKSVDSIDVVKAMDINLDGSISYFPLTDGSAIVTKQLQMDGTSKTVVYEPVKEENKEQPKANINEELMNKIKQDNISLKEGMDSIKNQIEDLSENFEKLFDEMKSIKGGKR